MKTFLTCWACLAVAAGAMAVDKAGLDFGIRKLAVKFDALQAKPDKAIPADVLRQAQGVVLLDRTKAGFIFAFQGGGGVALARGSKSGEWGAPAFVKANEASLGLQIGGQRSFVVILLMNTNALKVLAQGPFGFGGEAGGTAGSQHAAAEGTTSDLDQMIRVYGDTAGLYGGAAIKGGAITSDADANFTCHRELLSMYDILVARKGKPTAASKELGEKIDQYSK